MARIKIELPVSFPFTAIIPIRITDINYGGHVGNDTVLSVIHEARMQFLHQFGYTEMNFAGVGMIMSDVAIEFKSELFYGDIVKVSVAIVSISKVAFELCYKIEKEVNKNIVFIIKSFIESSRHNKICHQDKYISNSPRWRAFVTRAIPHTINSTSLP